MKIEENGLGWCVKNNIELSLIAVKTSRTKIWGKHWPREFKTIEESRKNE